jgi:hypothetical protein
MIKNIIREVPPEQTEFSFYFGDDGYFYNLFIVAQSRNVGNFNGEEYTRVTNEIENLLEMYMDIINKSNYAQYPSIGSMLLDYKLIKNIHNTRRIKEFTDYFAGCCEHPQSPYANYIDNFTAHTEESVAEYLTLKTGKEWDVDSAYGYCQDDYVKVIYCKEHYTSGGQHYGEVWLGAAKEFYTIDLDENGEEGDTCFGYIIADCQARTDEDYKKLVCEWACIPEEETRLEMIESSHTYTKYEYRTA